MTISEWQAKPSCIISANEIFANPVFIEMLKVLEDENPVKCPHIKNMTSQDVLVEHGFIKGYSHCIGLLKRLGTATPEFKEPEAYFSEPNNQ